MIVTKRVYCLHNGFSERKEITKFVNKEGIVAKHDYDKDYMWWEHLGLFMTRSRATKYAKDHHIKLCVHSIVIHTDWMYEMALKDMVKEN